MKKLILVFGLLFISLFIYPAGYDLKKSIFHALNTNDGLVSNEVTCFIQDNAGFLWIGTTNGLSRYDGYGFKSYKSNYLSPDFFTGNSIRALAKDNRDRLFVGTTSGLNIFDLKTGAVKQFPIETMNCGIINTLAVDKNGVLYIGTAIGVLRMNENEDSFDNIRYDANGTELRGNYIQSLFIDSRNVLWIGMWHTGFCALDLNENLFYTYPDIVNNRLLSITSFCEDKNNDIWLSTWNEDGVYRLQNPLQKGTFKLSIYPVLYEDVNAPSTPSVYGVLQDDKQGYVWVATSDGLKLITDPDNINSIVNYRNIEVNGIVSNEISAIYKDNTGIIWFSMYGAGCSSIDLNKKYFSEYYFPELKSNNEIKTITSIYEDESGLLWMGVKAHNLILFDSKQKKVYRYFNDPILKALAPQSNAVMSFARHSIQNELWLATRYHGVYVAKLKNNKPQSMLHLDESKLKSPNINKIVEGLNGYMWVATTEGVNYIENTISGKYTCHASDIIDEVIGKNIINTLWYDKKQTLWIGTQDDGLFKLLLKHDGTPKIISQYNIANEKINNNSIVSIYSDSKNRFWIGTNGGGLSLYNPENDCFEVIANMTAMPDDAIYAIEEDSSGFLWLSTGKGLVCFNTDLPVERQIRTFSSENDLDINSFYQGASCKGRNGELFFGASNGLLWFSTNDFFENTNSPTPVITDISIGNKSITELIKDDKEIKYLPPYTEELKISHKNNSVRIEFASLSYENSMSKTYAYKLQGIDDDWIYVKAKDRYAVYNNLKKGGYDFRVKTYNEDGYTNNGFASLRIVRQPAPWETFWAYLIYLFAVCALIYFIFRFLINRMDFKRTLEIGQMERLKSEEVHQAKLQFFTNISHELFTPITVLSCSLDDLASQQPQDSSLIYIMRMNLNRLMRLLQQILEFRKAETGNLKLKVSQGNIAGFINEICEISFIPLMKTKQIQFRLHAEPEVLIGYFDSDKLDKIMYNLLSNAHKYNSVGGEISVGISKKKANNKNYVCIKVKDTGQGIEQEKMNTLFKRFYEGDYRKFKTKGTGIGLSLTKDLVTLHNGSIDVSSKVGEGTEFTVTLPIDSSAYSAEQIDSSSDIITIAPVVTKEVQTTAIETETTTKDIAILVAEDNEDLLIVLENTLSRDFEVFKALNGVEALKILEENDIDIVVTDYIMPEMDGIELTRFIKKEVKYSHIPIILLTAKQDTSDKVIGFEAGADVYITKPFEIESLIANIKSLVKNRKKISALFPSKDKIKLSQFTYNSIDKDFLEKAIKIVEESVRISDFNATDFYQAMNMSQPTLYRKIKSMTNLSPNEFIRNIKFKLACKLLVERKLSVSEVAYELGFTDSRYFSTVFKKEIGMSPSEYIKMHKNG